MPCTADSCFKAALKGPSDKTPVTHLRRGNVHRLTLRLPGAEEGRQPPGAAPAVGQAVGHLSHQVVSLHRPAAAAAAWALPADRRQRLSDAAPRLPCPSPGRAARDSPLRRALRAPPGALPSRGHSPPAASERQCTRARTSGSRRLPPGTTPLPLQRPCGALRRRPRRRETPRGGAGLEVRVLPGSVCWKLVLGVKGLARALRF